MDVFTLLNNHSCVKIFERIGEYSCNQQIINTSWEKIKEWYQCPSSSNLTLNISN